MLSRAIGPLSNSLSVSHSDSTLQSKQVKLDAHRLHTSFIWPILALEFDMLAIKDLEPEYLNLRSVLPLSDLVPLDKLLLCAAKFLSLRR